MSSVVISMTAVRPVSGSAISKAVRNCEDTSPRTFTGASTRGRPGRIAPIPLHFANARESRCTLGGLAIDGYFPLVIVTPGPSAAYATPIAMSSLWA